jgi:TonB family protein
LQILLQGTGLLPRYTAADAFVLVPSSNDPGSNPPINTAPPAVVAQYYGRVQSSLKLAFCSNNRTQPGGYRIAVSFWIGSSGSVSRVELLGSTGNGDLDVAIDHTMRTLVIGLPPPPGFAQPVTLVVAPQSAGMTRDCQAARAERPGRAAR